MATGRTGALWRKIGDCNDANGRARRYLAQEHRAELAGPDEADAHGALHLETAHCKLMNVGRKAHPKPLPQLAHLRCHPAVNGPPPDPDGLALAPMLTRRPGTHRP